MALNAIRSGEAETLALLAAERSRHPDIADSLDLHMALLEARAEFADVTSPAIRADEARARLGRGEPLLRTQDLAPDWDSVVRLFKIIYEVGARYRPDQANAFARLPAEAVPFEQAARDYLTATDYASSRRIPLERTRADCTGYLKTIDLRELVGEVHLPAERVLTISMDAAIGSARGILMDGA